MKITGELKQAIRAVCDERRAEAAQNSKRKEDAIKSWINKTPRLKKLYAEKEKLELQVREIGSELNAFGLASWKYDLQDNAKAERHGFKFAELCPPRFEAVIARLACVDEKERASSANSALSGTSPKISHTICKNCACKIRAELGTSGMQTTSNQKVK